MNTAQGVGSLMRSARQQVGMSQAALARALEVSGAAVSLWESGKRELTVTQLVIVAEVVGVEPAELIP